MYGLCKQLLTSTGLPQNQDRYLICRNSAGKAYLAGNRLALMNDLLKLWCLELGCVRQSPDPLTASLEILWKEVAGQIEEEINRLNAFFSGGLDQLGWETRLRQNDPDGGHCWCARTYVKSEFYVIARQACLLEV